MAINSGLTSLRPWGYCRSLRLTPDKFIEAFVSVPKMRIVLQFLFDHAVKKGTAIVNKMRVLQLALMDNI